MEHAFWAERWAKGQTGFHLREVNPHLVRHVDALAGAPTRILVPLCGKSHDLAWLAARGHEVWGVEFVEAAARAFFAERDLVAEERRAGAHLALFAAGVSIVVADALAVTPEGVGVFPAIYDRAALIALPSPLRRPYVEALRRLATDDARMLLVSCEHDMGSGPPHSVPPPEVADLMSGSFSLDLLEEHDVLSAEPRFRERGATRMNEQVYLGQAAQRS